MTRISIHHTHIWSERIRSVSARIAVVTFFLTAIAAGFLVPLDAAHAGFWGSVFDSTVGNVFKWIGQFVFWLSGFVALVGGWALDASIAYSLNTTNWAIPSVNAAWSIIRDIANMTFIFILLYIAISTILQLGDHRKTLVNLIIVAFLVNFSLFFTKVIVDATNILALLFYNAITSGGIVDIGDIFRNGLKLESVFDPSQLKNIGNSQLALGYIIGSMVLLLAGFSFFTVAIMFVVRTVALIILMFLSPLALVAWILPETQKHWQTWWNMLLSQSFFAPIYLLMIYLVAKIITEGNLGGGGGNWAGAIQTLSNEKSTDYSMLSVFITYFIVLFLINAALVAAKTLGGKTAALGTKYAGKALGMGFGGISAIGRRTIGRGFAALSRSERFRASMGMAMEKGGITGFAARQALQGTDFMSRAGFDIRGGKMGALVGAGAGAVGADFGKAGGKGGFEAIREAQINKKVGAAKLLGKGAVTSDEIEVAKQLKEMYAAALGKEKTGPFMTAEAKRAAAEKIRKTFKDRTEKDILEALEKGLGGLGKDK